MIVSERELVCRHVDRFVLDVYTRSQQRTRRHISIRGRGPAVIGAALVKHQLAASANAVLSHAQLHGHVVACVRCAACLEGVTKHLPIMRLVRFSKGKVTHSVAGSNLSQAEIHHIVQSAVSPRPNAHRVGGFGFQDHACPFHAAPCRGCRTLLARHHRPRAFKSAQRLKLAGEIAVQLLHPRLQVKRRARQHIQPANRVL